MSMLCMFTLFVLVPIMMKEEEYDEDNEWEDEYENENFVNDFYSPHCK